MDWRAMHTIDAEDFLRIRANRSKQLGRLYGDSHCSVRMDLVYIHHLRVLLKQTIYI